MTNDTIHTNMKKVNILLNYVDKIKKEKKHQNMYRLLEKEAKTSLKVKMLQ